MKVHIVGLDLFSSQKSHLSKMKKQHQHVEDPSFFKILIPDFASKLLLPPAFSRDNERVLREGKVKLRCSSGRTWKVRLERTDGGRHEFTRGWSRFAKDAGLKFGELLVFSVAGKSLFDVSVWGVTCCRRELPVVDFHREGSGSDQDIIQPGVLENEVAKQKNPLYFETELRKHRGYILTLPKKFYLAAGLLDKGGVWMEYRPGKKRSRWVEINFRDGKSRRLDLASGWTAFRRANKMVFGRRYSFEFNFNKNVIRVQEVVDTDSDSE